MAHTFLTNRASYQSLNGINNARLLTSDHQKTLKDIATQANLVASSKTINLYNLRMDRLRSLVRSLPCFS